MWQTIIVSSLSSKAEITMNYGRLSTLVRTMVSPASDDLYLTTSMVELMLNLLFMTQCEVLGTLLSSTMYAVAQHIKHKRTKLGLILLTILLRL